MKPPLSLYVHVPWCIRKCPYCDFNSHAASGALPEDAYVEALLRDLAADIDTFGECREVRSVFFGGGTPSLLSAKAIAAFLAGAQQLLTFAPDIEITLEANPGAVHTREGAEKFAGFLSAGVNRLSLGVQSFDDTNLSALGRIHTAAQARIAIAAAYEAGFGNINLDLMHGLPGQDTTGALRDLEQAIACAPAHISWYQLTIEPNTVFYKRPPPLPGEDALWEIYQSGMMLLESRGYRRYEVSAFARDARSCRHNLNYWRFGDYLGVGAGAHGKMTLHDRIVRTAKTRLPRNYLQAPRRNIKPVANSDLPVEFLMNALRLTGGFSRPLFEAHTGLSAASLDTFLARASSRKLIETAEDRIWPTATGLQFLNSLLVMAIEDVHLP